MTAFSVGMQFQSTRPRGTRLFAASIDLLTSCFNPRVRAGRDKAPAAGAVLKPVSIHASARDATHDTSKLNGDAGFNPRVRAGRDGVLDDRRFDVMVSIHASARDATRWKGTAVADLQFQSTRPRGTRQRLGGRLALHQLFQSTRPRGTRPTARQLSRPPLLFQSTRPRGTRLILCTEPA